METIKKITRKRTPEHNRKIAEGVKKSMTEEKKRKHSELMKSLWAKIKNT